MSNGNVFSMHCLDAVWYLELGPQAKGNKMKGGAGRGRMGKSQKQWVETVQAWARCQRSRKPWTQGEAKGSHAGSKGC